MKSLLFDFILLAAISAIIYAQNGNLADNEFAEFEVADENFPQSDVESIFEDASKHRDTTDNNEEEANMEEEEKPFQADEEFAFGEEFEDGIERKLDEKGPSGEKNTLDIKPLTFADIPAHFRSNWSNYQVEALALVIIFLYVLSYIYGKTRNYAIASGWLAKNHRLLEQQFSLVGDDGVSQEPAGGQLIRETDSNFSVWSSGRVGCQGMTSQLRLQKRQDLLSYVVNVFRPRRDRVLHRIDLDRGEMDSFVFILGQRKSVVGAVKELTDLNTYTVERRNADRFGGLPTNFTLFAEIAETIPSLIDAKALNFIKNYEKYIEYFHFSDQYSGARPQDEGSTAAQLPETKPTLHFSYYILPGEESEEKEEEIYANLMHFTFFMVERIRHYRLSKEGKNKADKKRQAVEEMYLRTTHQQRQEAAQARREEKARERKQRVMEEEDPDKQRRLEKLEQKREAKLRQPKMKQVRMK